jgi:protein-S-isoprenylcysteine O-methyltransferase Ste14
MKATRFEFRFRLAIIAVIYLLGFWTPWERFGPLATENPARLWSWLAIQAARTNLIPTNAAYIAITAIAAALAIAGVWLRLWGTAYMGRSIVFDNVMHAGAVVAVGPYRYLRNPLYLGSVFTAFAMSILMPASGALFFLVAFSFFVARLALGEEAFLRDKIGDAYVEYCRRVPRWLPGIAPRLPAMGARGAWLPAVLGEVFPLGMAVCFAALAWRYDANLLIRCALVCFGLSLVSRALRPKSAAQ